MSPQQVVDIEHSLQATFHYLPGLITVNYVTLDKSVPNNPIQVLEYPLSDTDRLPTNQAIAKIGEVWIYWKLLGKALRTGKYNFFDFQSFEVLPVYLDDNNQPSVIIDTIQSWNGLYGKTPYVKYVPLINYGGDADFVGSWKPSNSVPLDPENGNRASIPHRNIGVTVDTAKSVFDNAHQVSLSENDEITKLILSRYNDFPVFLRQIIDLTLEYGHSLKGTYIARAYYLHKANPNDAEFDKVIDYLTQFVKTEFSKHLSVSPTIVAVDNLSDSLEEMYRQALPYYK